MEMAAKVLTKEEIDSMTEQELERYLREKYNIISADEEKPKKKAASKKEEKGEVVELKDKKEEKTSKSPAEKK